MTTLNADRVESMVLRVGSSTASKAKGKSRVEPHLFNRVSLSLSHHLFIFPTSFMTGVLAAYRDQPLRWSLDVITRSIVLIPFSKITR